MDICQLPFDKVPVLSKRDQAYTIIAPRVEGLLQIRSQPGYICPGSEDKKGQYRPENAGGSYGSNTPTWKPARR